MNNLSTLKSKIESKYTVSPEIFDGITLDYGEFSVGLLSTGDWLIHTQDERLTITTDRLNIYLDEAFR